MAQRAVFFDKDGTLINDVPYNVNPARITLADGAAAAVKTVVDLGYLPVVISNQSGVAHGYFRLADLDGVVSQIRALLHVEGADVTHFYFCPHHPDGAVVRYAVPCNCRKPAPGLILQAADALDIDVTQSWMVGDILHDVEAGKRAGCKTILIDNGNETEWKSSPQRTPDFVATTLTEAAGIITANTLTVCTTNLSIT